MSKRTVNVLVEKEKHNFIPQSARELMGWPIEYEWKEVPEDVAAVMDNRIMADGRPAHAWWAELEELRRQRPQIEEDRKIIQEQFRALRIAKWAAARDVLNGNIVIRFTLDPDASIESLCEAAPTDRAREGKS